MKTTKRRDLYQEVTDQIIKALEEGTAPWVRPWDADTGLPRNGNSGRHYNGINVLLLWQSAMVAGYGSNDWFTYKGAKRAGGHVRKGESGTLVVFWKLREVEERDPETGEIEEKTIPFLRYFYLFNRDQCEGLPEPETPSEAWDPHDAAEAVLGASGADIRHGAGRAYYSPSGDFIMLPSRYSFEDAGAYYSTALHELTHWTGHADRMDRGLGGVYGAESYAFEELVAEIGSAFVCASLGVRGMLQHPEYVAHWIKKLKDDNRLIFKADKLAREASDYILAFQEEAAEAEAIA